MSTLLPLLLVHLAAAAPGESVAAAPAPAAPAGAVAPPSVRVGQVAPQFILPALNSSVAQGLVDRPEVALGDFVGIRPPHGARAVVVTFLHKDGGEATLAALQRLHRKHGKSVRVLAVLVDGGDLATASAWVESLRLEYPVLRDGYHIVTERYGVSTWPLTFVVNGEGTIEGIGVARENLETELDAILTASAARK